MNNSIGASLEAIQSHYDVGNEFYHLWLDESTKTYSSALFHEDDTLETAQLRKIDHHIDASKAQVAESVLDIGCGWGGTLQRTIERNPHVKCVGLTLSEAQQSYVDSLKLQNTEVKLESWEAHQPNGKYDSIISIGAFEHFANHDQSPTSKVAGYRKFFKKCHSWLNEGKCLSLQTITYENSSRADFSEFFENEIFPESDLPRIHEIASSSDGLFEIVNMRGDRHHYYLTMKEWWRNLKENKEVIVSNYGDGLFDRYNRYLQMCMIGFRSGSMGLARITFRKIDSPNPSIGSNG